MLLLTSTSDIVEVVTDSAVSSINVHASWVDNASGTITPGRTNTAITTATTTTVVASPAASTQRNVKGLFITNTSAANCVVTVVHTDGTTAAQLMSVTLRGGESLTLDDTGNWTHLDFNGAAYTPLVATGLFNGGGGGSGFAVDTQIAGSSILLPSGINFALVMYECVFNMSKTAAGTQGISVTVRLGTNNSTSDSSRGNVNFGVGTAAIDSGIFTVRWINTVAGASAQANVVVMCNHSLAATGLISTGAAGTGIQTATTGTFDSTTANTYLSVSLNGGTAFVGTLGQVQARVFNYRG